MAVPLGSAGVYGWPREDAIRVAVETLRATPTSVEEARSRLATRSESERIRFIRTVMPDSKLIFLMRNPIDRAWSHAKKDLMRKQRRRVEEVSPEEFRVFFGDDYQRRCGGSTLVPDGEGCRQAGDG